MNEDDARRALATVTGLSVEMVASVPGGWDSWTFEVNGSWIVRFPRSAHVARSTERELALLPLLARAMPVPVPEPRWTGTRRKRPFFGYSKVNGSALLALDPDRDARLCSDLGHALGRLHSVSLDPVRRVRGMRGSLRTRRRAHLRLAAEATRRLGPRLGPAAAAGLDRVFERLAGTESFTPTLVHGDLNPEHLLVDGCRRLVGIIDWGDAHIGDPAIDFAGLWRAFGPAATATVGRAYRACKGGADARLLERASLYGLIADVQDLLHGPDDWDAAEASQTLERLRTGLATMRIAAHERRP